MSEAEIAKQIVAKILHDLTGRRGLRQVWDSIDQDIQQEIVARLEEIALETIHGAT